MYKIIIIAILLLLLLYKKKDNFGNNNVSDGTVVFITRFSIFDCKIKAWKLNKMSNDCSDIKKKLFDKKRLQTKLEAFKKITYSSIKKQTQKNFIWLIYISNVYPDEYLQKLKGIINSSNIKNKIKLIPVKNIDGFHINCSMQLKKISGSGNFISVRLDDDDGLSPSFIKTVSKYRNKSNHIISFPKGKNVTIKDEKVIYGSNITKKKIALGLSGVNMNIHTAGDHTLVDKKHPIIYDNSENMYYLFCSNITDSKIKFF